MAGTEMDMVGVGNPYFILLFIERPTTDLQ